MSSMPDRVQDALLAKLRALRTTVGTRLEDARARYFDPEMVLDEFKYHLDLADRLRETAPHLFGDLAQRTLPPSSGTSDYEGRGYIARRYLHRLLEDIDYALNIATHASEAASTKTTSDVDRHFMELAVAEATKCVGEAGRTTPKVGAVVARGDQLIATGYRGELKLGDHAEYTALQGKCNAVTLAGTTVYTTLEPCTARNAPKIPCVERLIARKISRVVIGMLDPNDIIRGRGILLLRRANIEVGLFPPDLMAQLEELNRDFIGQHEVASSKSASTIGASHRADDAQTVPLADFTMWFSTQEYLRDDRGEVVQHNYLLHVRLRNPGPRTVTRWHIDVDLPELLKRPFQTYTEASSNEPRVMRVRFTHAQRTLPLYPDDSVEFEVPYMVNNSIYARRDEVFSMPIRARAFIDDTLIATRDGCVRAFQEF